MPSEFASAAIDQGYDQLIREYNHVGSEPTTSPGVVRVAETVELVRQELGNIRRKVDRLDERVHGDHPAGETDGDSPVGLVGEAEDCLSVARQISQMLDNLIDGSPALKSVG